MRENMNMSYDEYIVKIYLYGIGMASTGKYYVEPEYKRILTDLNLSFTDCDSDFINSWMDVLELLTLEVERLNSNADCEWIVARDIFMMLHDENYKGETGANAAKFDEIFGKQNKYGIKPLDYSKR